MKCPNCGAELQTNPDQEIRFCQYCGHKVEVKPETPATMAGAVHSIAKGVINEFAKEREYQREHAEEILERRKKEERERLKQSLWILLISVLLVGGIIAFAMFMSAKEKGL